MGCPAIQIANPKGASRPIPALMRRASARRSASPRGVREKRHRYGWTASSGSVVGNDPVNKVDPGGLCTVGDGPTGESSGQDWCEVTYGDETQAATPLSDSVIGMQAHYQFGDGSTVYYDPAAYSVGADCHECIVGASAAGGGTGVIADAIAASQAAGGQAVPVRFRTNVEAPYTTARGLVIGQHGVEWSGTLSVADGRYSISATGTMVDGPYDFAQDGANRSLAGRAALAATQLLPGLRPGSTWSQGTSFRMLPNRPIYGTFGGPVRR